MCAWCAEGDLKRCSAPVRRYGARQEGHQAVKQGSKGPSSRALISFFKSELARMLA
jgi:hypothetical protein